MIKGIFNWVLFVCTIISLTEISAQERIFVEGGPFSFQGEKVFVDDFEISKYEITNTEFASFLNANNVASDGVLDTVQIINIGSPDLQLEYKHDLWVPKVGKEKFPMVMVNYFGALEFCRWSGGDLPTEIQWIYAASGGQKSKNYTYAGSNNYNDVGWFSENSGAHSHIGGEKKPNELGIYDMSGNVWEWSLNKELKTTDDFCVHKGGSWYAEEEPGSILSRYGNTPLHYSNSVGIRIIYTSED